MPLNESEFLCDLTNCKANKIKGTRTHFTWYLSMCIHMYMHDRILGKIANKMDLIVICIIRKYLVHTHNRSVVP